MRLMRHFLFTAGTLIALLASVGARAEYAPNAEERANLNVVQAFMSTWNTPDVAVMELSENASIRMVEDQPAAVGRDAAAAAFKSFLVPGVRVEVEVLETTVHGPVVVNSRIDTVKTEGKPDELYPVTGVFVVKNGKIVEWSDYLLK